MMVMTAKVDFKKILVALAAAAALILALILLLGGGETTQTSVRPVTSNDGRVAFLKGFGWEVTTSPTDSGRCKIPGKSSQVFDRYNDLQKSQGYDLSQFAGKNVMRYVYQVNNYPGATEPVYATVLVHKNQIIGGDVTDTAAKGHIQGFQMPQGAATAPSTAPVPSETEMETTVPTIQG